MQANGALVIQTLVGLNVWISQLVGTSTIGGYFLNVRVPKDNHLRLYGKSSKVF